MIKHTLNRIRPILDRQADQNPAHTITIIMYHTSRRNRILNKLVSQHRFHIKLFDVLVEMTGNLFDW